MAMLRIPVCWKLRLRMYELQNFLINVISRYDGQRAQIHRLLDGSVRIFSRQMKESTLRFPDLVNMIKELCRPEVSSFILDAEVSLIHKKLSSFFHDITLLYPQTVFVTFVQIKVVGIDRKKGNKLMSFQELSSRERGNKHSSIAIENIKVIVRFTNHITALCYQYCFGLYFHVLTANYFRISSIFF